MAFSRQLLLWKNSIVENPMGSKYAFDPVW